MRIIIAGGRDFNNYELLKNSCIDIIESLGYSNDPDDYEIISGGARGADSLGEVFAKEMKYDLKVFPAQWDLYGKSAGYIRNKEMAEYASLDDVFSVLIAFWDGKSRGTKNMIEIAKKELNMVKIVNY